ncbi:MAG: cupin domain-containing protein [Chloroflexi bacterium]|nr:cupin domain-containing protein [Chloroflexota bacterium]
MRRRVEKPWGYELIFARTAKYVGKILFIKKGHRLSLQYHEHKDETIYVQSGELTVQLEGADGKLVSMQFSGGESVRIEPLKRHRMQAITDTTLFEVSTPELDDVKRVEDDYGRAQ